jgi:hypothetical protein
MFSSAIYQSKNVQVTEYFKLLLPLYISDIDSLFISFLIILVASAGDSGLFRQN